MNKIKNNKTNMFLWNTVGSMCNAGASFILLIFVTRICGKYDAGIFTLGFSNAQLMLTIGKFGMRAYQATDINNTIKFPTYLFSRILTSILMVLFSLTYILLAGYSVEKAIIFISTTLIKSADALEDVFHGLFQKNNRIDLAGKFLTIRNLFTIITFIFILLLSRELMTTCIITAIVSVIASIALNLPIAIKKVQIDVVFSIQELRILIYSCFPLFVGSFLSLLVYNIPKYSIDIFLTEDIQTYFSILFMPTFVINLFSDFIFKPLLTELAYQWNENRLKRFAKYIKRLLLIIIVLTLIVVVGGYFVGNILLSLIYGIDITPYRTELVILLFGGGFSAAVYLLFNVLATIRRQANIFVGYLSVAVITTITCPFLVKRYNIRGASVSYLISSGLLFTIFLFMLVTAVLKKIKSKEEII